MRWRFHQPSEARQARSWQRPPNYLSRRLQGRLFVLTAALFLVLLAIREASNPRTFEWLAALPQRIQEAALEEPVDTRYAPAPSSSGEPSGASAPIVRGPSSDDADGARKGFAEDRPGGAEPDAAADLESAARDAWSATIQSLDQPQRELLLASLKRSRDGEAMPAADRAAWRDLVAGLAASWEAHLAGLREALTRDAAKLTDAERNAWSRSLAGLETRWRGATRPALERLAGDLPVDEEGRRALAQMQSTLDALFLAAVRDNTVFRPDEKDAWFRLLEQLAQRPPEELERESVGRVGFLSLYRQPEAYRGKLVTCEGSVRRGSWRAAPPNLYGIGGYYILWLKPSGSNSPIVVYSLELPAGFPQAEPMEAGGDDVPLDEPVRVTGYFFKRWAYRAQDTTRLAPLVLTNSPRWDPPQEPAVGRSAFPQPAAWMIMLGGTLAFAVCFTLAVYRYTRSTGRTVRKLPPSPFDESISTPLG